MHWFGEGPETEEQDRGRTQREAGYNGWLDKHNNPIMSRVDPSDGQALSFTDRGWDGRGTPDEDRARRLR